MGTQSLNLSMCFESTRNGVLGLRLYTKFCRSQSGQINDKPYSWSVCKNDCTLSGLKSVAKISAALCCFKNSVAEFAIALRGFINSVVEFTVELCRFKKLVA